MEFVKFKAATVFLGNPSLSNPVRVLKPLSVKMISLPNKHEPEPAVNDGVRRVLQLHKEKYVFVEFLKSQTVISTCPASKSALRRVLSRQQMDRGVKGSARKYFQLNLVDVLKIQGGGDPHC